MLLRLADEAALVCDVWARARTCVYVCVYSGVFTCWQELRKVCDDEGIDTKGLVEKDEYIKKIKAHFNIKDEV